MPQTPTPKQRKAAEAVAENLRSAKPLPTGQVLANVGYGEIKQDPKRITESIGFKQALREMGLTEELITNALVDDIKAKPKNRVQEIKLGAEILGMKSDEEKPKEKGTNIYNLNFFSKEFQEDIQNLEQKIKAKLTQKNVQEN